MPITIGSNIAALQTQRSLARASDGLRDTFTRLSSGMRINRASDDAAGLAISDSLRADSKVYAQAVRNVSDGISLLNIAEGTLTQLSSIVTRQKELAEQSANGTYSNRQRVALQRESDALSNEYNRILQSAEFNGTRVIDGIEDQLRIQQGYGVEQSTLLSVGSQLGVAAGDGTFRLGMSFSAAQLAQSDDFNNDGHADLVYLGGAQIRVALGNGDGSFGALRTFQGGPGGALYDVQTGDFNGDGNADVVAGYQSATGVYFGNGDGTFRAGQQVEPSYAGIGQESAIAGDVNGDGRDDLALVNYSGNYTRILFANADGTFTLSGTYAAPGVGNGRDARFGDVNNDGSLDLVMFSQGTGAVFLNRGDGTFGAAITMGQTSWNGTLGDLNNDGILDAVSDSIVLIGNGDGTFARIQGLGFGGSPNQRPSIGDFNGDGIADILRAPTGSPSVEVWLGRGDGRFDLRNSFAAGGVNTNGITADFDEDGILDFLVSTDGGTSQVFLGNADATGRRNNFQSKLDISSRTSARTALDETSRMLERINNELGMIGAFQSRLQVGSENLQVSRENFEAARSRILDADIASETSTLVRMQILQQAGTAILTQANQSPALALVLLRR